MKRCGGDSTPHILCAFFDDETPSECKTIDDKEEGEQEENQEFAETHLPVKHSHKVPLPMPWPE